MDISSLYSIKNIGILGAFAGIGVFWNQFKSGLSTIRSFLIVNVKIKGCASIAFQGYALRHFKKSPFGDKCFSSVKNM